MKAELSPPLAETIIAWAHSTSFPVGVAGLIFLRIHFGVPGQWPIPRNIGIVLICMGLIILLRDLFLPRFYTYSDMLRRQSIYASVWISLVGIWFYWDLLRDLGFIILITFAVCLWSFSHREVLRLKGR